MILPIQSIGVPSEVDVYRESLGASGDESLLPGDSILVQFASDYSHAHASEMSAWAPVELGFVEGGEGAVAYSRLLNQSIDVDERGYLWGCYCWLVLSRGWKCVGW
ncbi:MAG: hypothetical protein FWD57_01595 [Polyangiaceae bacterium]|nr:hypothetical protein [Polyangiaceae bacterium]